MSPIDLIRQAHNEEIRIVKPSGKSSAVVKCRFQERNKVEVLAESLDIDRGDKIYRALPSNKEEVYEVLDFHFENERKLGNSTLMCARYLIECEKIDLLARKREGSQVNSPRIVINGSSNIQIGDGNVQEIISGFSQLAKLIDSAEATDEDKQQAKNLLSRLIENPIVSPILSGVTGGSSGAIVRYIFDSQNLF